MKNISKKKQNLPISAPLPKSIVELVTHAPCSLTLCLQLSTQTSKGFAVMWIVFTALRANIIKQKSVSSSISSCCFHIAAHTCCISAFWVRPVDTTLWARWRQQVNVITFEAGHTSWQSHSVIFSILLDEVGNALRVNQCEGGCVVFSSSCFQLPRHQSIGLVVVWQSIELVRADTVHIKKKKGFNECWQEFGVCNVRILTLYEHSHNKRTQIIIILTCNTASSIQTLVAHVYIITHKKEVRRCLCMSQCV